jgi:hypothetical protein
VIAPDPRRPRDAGRIVGDAFRIYSRNFTALITIALIVMPVELLVGVLQARFTSDDARAYISLLLLPGVLVTLIAAAALTIAVHDITGGTRPEAGRSLDTAIQRAGALLSTVLLAAGLGVASLFAAPLLALWWLVRRDARIDGERNWWLAIIPGLLTAFLSVRWALATPAVIIEGRSGWPALDSSAGAVHGRWWRTLGVLLLIGLLQLGPVVLASAAAAGPPIVAGGVSSVVAALVLPFVVTAQTLLYYDLKARSHADARADRFSAAEQDVPR